MIQIKLRAWDFGYKKMYKNVGIIPSDDVVYIKEDMRIRLGKDCAVMQFIGLTDKNKKEIYEGDILRGAGQMGYVNFLVQWNKLGMKFDIMPIKKNFDRDLFKYCKSVEVIGNIFENSELLEKEK